MLLRSVLFGFCYCQQSSHKMYTSSLPFSLALNLKQPKIAEIRPRCLRLTPNGAGLKILTVQLGSQGLTLVYRDLLSYHLRLFAQQVQGMVTSSRSTKGFIKRQWTLCLRINCLWPCPLCPCRYQFGLIRDHAVTQPQKFFGFN